MSLLHAIFQHEDVVFEYYDHESCNSSTQWNGRVLAVDENWFVFVSPAGETCAIPLSTIFFIATVEDNSLKDGAGEE